MAREPRNIATSVRTRLQDLARQQQGESQRVPKRRTIEAGYAPIALRRGHP